MLYCIYPHFLFYNYTGRDFSVSAVVNVGWMADKDSSDWLKKWDWNNDASHHVDLQDGVTEYTKDIEVKQYTASGEREEPTCGAVHGRISILSVTLFSFLAMLLIKLVLS